MADSVQSEVVDLGDAVMLSGSADPTIGAGVTAPEGSLYLRDTGAGTGILYFKRGAADTAWDEAGGGGNVGSNAWSAPPSPNAWNSEFEDGTLDGWTRATGSSNTVWTPAGAAIDVEASFNTGDARESNNSFRRSWLQVQPPYDGALWGYIKQLPSVFSDGHAIIMRCKTMTQPSGMTAANGEVQLQLTADDSGAPSADDWSRVRIRVSSFDMMWGFEVFEGGAQSLFDETDRLEEPAAYAGLLFEGTDKINAFYSRDGRSWSWINSYTFPGNPNYEWVRIGAIATDQGYVDVGNIVMGFDFVRLDTLGRLIG